MKDSHILLIGGTGFIGRYLNEALKKHGFLQVKAVSRSTHGADITDPRTLEPHISKSDVVINLAGYISFLRKDREKIFKVNHEGAINVLKLCEKHDKRLIHISSTASFGFSPDMINEDFEFDWKKYKHLFYSYSKHLPNKEINDSELSTNIIYPSLVVGPGDKTNTAKLFAYVKKRKRIFVPPGMNGIIDVRDLAEAIVAVLMKAGNKENYIANGENVTFKDLFSTIADILGQKSRVIRAPHFLHKPIFYFSRILEIFKASVPSENLYRGFKKREYDISKIKGHLGFNPKFTYRKSLEDSLKSLHESISFGRGQK